MIETSVVLLAFALFLSLAVERVMEIVRAWEKYYEAKNNTHEKWNRRALKIRANADAQLNNIRSNNFTLVQLFLSRYFVYQDSGQGKVIAISADAVRTTCVSAFYKLIAIALGILLAFVFDIDLFALVMSLHPNENKLDSIIEKYAWLQWMAIPATGIAIGLGSGPLHKIITALERARKNRSQVTS